MAQYLHFDLLLSRGVLVYPFLKQLWSRPVFLPAQFYLETEGVSCNIKKWW